MIKGPVLQARGLTKRFGKGCAKCCDSAGPAFNTNVCPHCRSVLACNNVDFDLYSDEVLGVVGESGSGKSTLIRLCHFDWDITRGDMRLKLNADASRLLAWEPPDDNLFNLSPFRKRQLRNMVMGIVYQNPHLGLRMGISSGGNIAERLLMAQWRGVAKMRERASELLEKTEVPVNRMDEPPKNFSGGMQQRVQISKALSNSPVILLLDEVTTGLDVSVQARVLDLLRSLQQELHVATIVVSHDLGVIRQLTSRTMVMKHGQVVESGLTDQILEDPQHPYTQLLVSSAL
ncbi:MAG: ATP-binding cassette domain-containing protein [Verrucomicrobiota bacterium]